MDSLVSPTMGENVHRRRVLRYLAATTGTVAIAGCTGSDSDGGGADDETETEGETDDERGTDDETETETESEGETETEDETDESAETSLRLVHDTHLHGSMGETEEPLNIANYFGLMADLADDAPENALVVGNGDDLHMSVESSVFDGEHITTMFDAGPLSYDTYGNHEFDNGPESLRENVADSEFTWVSANVLDAESGDAFAAEEGATRYAIEEVDGVRVGITGLAPADTPEITSVGENVEVLDPVAASEAVLEDLEAAGADVVVLLSHLAGSVAEELVATVDGYDVVVGDHAARALEEPLEIDDTILSFVGDEFEFVGQLDLELTADGVADYAFERHDLEALVEEGEVEPHEEVADLLAEYEARLDEELDVVIGETTVDLDVRRETVRRTESNFGNWIADAMREDVDADVTLQNGGGIRSDQVYEAGEITRRMILDVLPFPNHVVKLAVSGETLREAVEHGVSAVEEQHGRFPQVSGLSFAYDPEAPVGERVAELTVAGEDVDPESTYELATNDFMMGGGDGYEMFAEAEVLRSPDEGALLSTLVMDRIEETGVISPETEGRIEVLDEDANALAAVARSPAR